MKAGSFEYRRARSVDEALALLARHGDGARLIAGGQSLVPALNLRLATPDMLIDIAAIDGLRGVQVLCHDGVPRLRIGALTRHADIERSPDIARHAPLLRRAVEHVAHAAIRNRGTFGGSIAHADPASELPACALALDATMHVTGADGARAIAARDFFLGLHETAIRPSEILLAVELDCIREGWRSGFAELARRQGDYAIVGLAAHGRPMPGRRRFQAIALAYFSVGAASVLAHAAAAALVDGDAEDGARLTAAREALASDLDPPGDPQASAALRMHLCRVLLGRVTDQMLAGHDA